MTDTNKERDAFKAYLRDCDGNAIVPDVGGAWHAAFQAGRASIAAGAGSEPVATIKSWTNGSYWRNYNVVFHRDDLPVGTDLYTHPSPPEGMEGGWIALPGALPEPGTPVLLDIGKKYPIRAMWAAKHTVQAADDDTDWGEYVEADDMYYAPEGWYEWNECEDNHWRVTETPRAWAPLPPTTSAGSRKGE